jgi:hypothetical protein
MVMKLKYKLIAIDFDDTIVYSDFPNIIGLRPHAVRVMEKIKDHGGEIIVWTARSDVKSAKDYLDFCLVPYDGINEDFYEVLLEYGDSSRKIYADVYIDDRNLETRENGGIDWLKIERMLFE